MNEIAKHIRRLLTENDCVILPQLGGFVAHTVPARYVEENALFQPPMRVLGFNAQLVMNDGLLIQSYMSAYDVTYPEAQALVEKDVHEVLDILSSEGEYVFTGIGVLRQKKALVFEFVEDRMILTSPMLYGLDVLEIVRCGVVAQREKPISFPVQGEEEKSKEEYVLRINRTFIHQVASIAAVLLLFCLYSVPIGSGTNSTRMEASLTNGLVFGLHEISSEPIMVEQSALVVPQTAVSPVVSPTSIKKLKGQESEKRLKTTETPGYTIVLASMVSQKNAEIFVTQLRKAGYGEAQVSNKKNIRRVIYSSYVSKSDAENELRRLRNEYNAFEDAWVLSVK